MRTTTGRTATGLLLVAVLGLLGAGCSEAQEAVSDGTERAACQVAEKAMDQAESAARSAVDKIEADPQAARQELTAVRDAVAAAASGLSGETAEQLERAREALDDLVRQARSSANGAADEQEVQQAREQLDEAVAGLGDVC